MFARIIAQFINNIHTKHKLLLTGTPLQNNTGELWPLLNFIDVSEAGSLERFKEEFGDLRSSEQVERLRTLLSKCMLRRVKEEVEKEVQKLSSSSKESRITDEDMKGLFDRKRKLEKELHSLQTTPIDVSNDPEIHSVSND